MAQEAGDRGRPPAPPPPLPPSSATAPFYARCDAALVDLDTWAQAKVTDFGFRGLAAGGAPREGGREGREPPGAVETGRGRRGTGGGGGTPP